MNPHRALIELDIISEAFCRLRDYSDPGPEMKERIDCIEDALGWIQTYLKLDVADIISSIAGEHRKQPQYQVATNHQKSSGGAIIGGSGV
ncbi:hypothetical protein ACFL44_03590 [Gemmatimonadota bacterium]